jgi:hypothetical protein
MQPLHIAKYFCPHVVRLATAALAVLVLGGGLEAHAVAADNGVPVLLSVVADSPSTLKVRWQDQTANEQNFEIYVAKDADPATVAGLSPYRASGLQGTGSIGTYEVTSLQESTYYCVRVDALLPRDDIGVPSTGLSDSLCATTQAVHLARPIQTRADDPGLCVACPGGQLKPAPTLPDLAVTDIRPVASSQVSAGTTASFEVVVANTGAKLPGPVQVQLQVSGSVAFYSLTQVPSGFTCSDANPVICVGPLGGYGDAPISTAVIFGVQVHADKTGLGSLSAAADPNSLIQESDETNNAKTLPITVK